MKISPEENVQHTWICGKLKNLHVRRFHQKMLPKQHGPSGYDEKKFKEEYSLTLNQLPINQKTADQIIDEANQAFTYNMKMFKELEGNLIAVLGKIVFNYITKKVRKGSTET